MTRAVRDMTDELYAANKQIEALQAFKDYVHRRLDAAGIPTHPEGDHSAAGCRVGDRLDIALGDAERLQFIAKHLWETKISWNKEPHTLKRVEIDVRATCESSEHMAEQFRHLIDDMKAGK